jgi:hypothetical protein
MAFDVTESEVIDAIAEDSVPQAIEDAGITPNAPATERPSGKPFLTRVK